nr:uncharacterized protein zf(c2h2)-60 isoform X2 [Ciona intestinalis]|eukprot:XP_002126462.2 uncharacterized protein zf(c2h2)-60 isoform X2 [Ciona intestinalis]
MACMPCKYLVVFNSTKKVITCNKTEIPDKIMDSFKLDQGFDMKLFDEDFEEWVSISDNLNELPSKGKLRVVTEEDVESDCTVPLNTSSESEESMARGETSKSWLLSYSLPKFPAFISDILETNEEISTHTRKKIGQIIFDSMACYTLYPTSFEYKSVCMALLKKYPNLADKSTKDVTGTWLVSLRQRFRDMRRPMYNNDTVKAMKRKYGFHARRDDDQLQSAKRVFVASDCTEDATSIKLHIKALDAELKKKERNLDILQDRMSRTYSIRRKEVQEGDLSILDIISKYSALRLPLCFLEEAQRVFKADIQAKLNAVNPNIWKKLGNLTKIAKPCELDKWMVDEKSLALLFLPRVFKEETELYMIYNMKKEELWLPESPYPCMVISKNEIGIYVQRVFLFNAENANAAAVMVFACYWVFDIEFPKKNRKSLSLLAALAEIEENVSTPVQRILNTIR